MYRNNIACLEASLRISGYHKADVGRMMHHVHPVLLYEKHNGDSTKEIVNFDNVVIIVNFK